MPLLDQNRQNKNKINNQHGQTLVEFILLLTSLMLISLFFLKGVNGSIADIWLNMAKIITDDPNVNIEFK